MAKVIRTTAAGVNIRTAPSTTATRVATVGAGVVLGASPNFGATVSGGGLQWYPTTLSAQAAASIGNPWYSGKTVYVAAQYAEAVDESQAASQANAEGKAKAEAAINQYMSVLNQIAQQNFVAAAAFDKIQAQGGTVPPALLARWQTLNNFVLNERSKALQFCGGLTFSSGTTVAGGCLKAVGLEQLNTAQIQQWRTDNGLSGLGFLPALVAAGRIALPWVVRNGGRLVTWLWGRNTLLKVVGGWVLIEYGLPAIKKVYDYFTNTKLAEANQRLTESNALLKEALPYLPKDLQDKAKGQIDDNTNTINENKGGGFFSQAGSLLKWGIVGAAAFLIIPKIAKK